MYAFVRVEEKLESMAKKQESESVNKCSKFSKSVRKIVRKSKNKIFAVSYGQG